LCRCRHLQHLQKDLLCRHLLRRQLLRRHLRHRLLAMIWIFRLDSLLAL
jgi:hypothetical protein